MKKILKRFANTLTVLITIGLLAVIFTVTGNVGAIFLFFCCLYALVLAFNYIILGTVTLWHKKEDML